MKHFAASFLLVLLAFAAGAYLVPDGAFNNVTEPVLTSVAGPAASPVPNSPTVGVPEIDRPGAESTYTQQELHTINLFEAASPSVCYITTKTRQRSFWNRNVTEVPSGSGSGFVWDEAGHIITNYHVIRGATQAVVTLGDGKGYQASLVGVAKEKDLAVLKIEAPASVLRPIPVGTSHNIRVGQAVYAIGNPFGLDQTLTTGVVSALDREINSQANVPIRGVIQTDAAINPGNSGGPLLDSGGELIGVNTAIYSPSGASAGIGFSIPVDVVRYVVPDLIQYGELRRASIGATFKPVRGGMALIEITPNSAAQRFGLQGIKQDNRGNYYFGDILTAINGQDVTNTTELYLEMEKYQPGQSVQLGIIRGEKELTVEILLDSSVD